MRTMTIEQLDEMNDDEFAAFVEKARPALYAEEEQRTLMVDAHKRWVATLDDDIRDGVDWNTISHSNWDLYAELRMNGVEFERSASMAMSR